MGVRCLDNSTPPGRLECYEKYKQSFTAEVQRRSAEMSVREAKEEARYNLLTDLRWVEVHWTETFLVWIVQSLALLEINSIEQVFDALLYLEAGERNWQSMIRQLSGE